MDDASVRRTLYSIATAIPRHYVVMEVKQNLVESDRKANLKRFPKSKFKRTAKVVMGKPSADFKKKVLEKVLEAKKTKVIQEWKKQKAEKEKKKAAVKRAKELAELQKKQQAEAEAKKKAAEEAKKAAEGEK